MKINNIFISGISSGIGKGLALHFASLGATVYGISRRALDYQHENIKHMQCDITSQKFIEQKDTGPNW